MVSKTWEGHRGIRVDLETWEMLESYRRSLGGTGRGHHVSMAKALRRLLRFLANGAKEGQS